MKGPEAGGDPRSTHASHPFFTNQILLTALEPNGFILFVLEALRKGMVIFMKTLLHICCAPCANQCIDVLRTDGFEVTGLWYNPNIHPFTEYRARRNCLREYAAQIELPVIEKNDYALRPFVREVAADISGRCVKCYEMRLFETAKAAAEGGFDSFTSSLFISPYQNHELMREVAERAAHEYGVEFLYRDFRPYFRDGQTFAREHGFYIQKYCGCVFSEEERYLKKNKIIL